MDNLNPGTILLVGFRPDSFWMTEIFQTNDFDFIGDHHVFMKVYVCKKPCSRKNRIFVRHCQLIWLSKFFKAKYPRTNIFEASFDLKISKKISKNIILVDYDCLD